MEIDGSGGCSAQDMKRKYVIFNIEGAKTSDGNLANSISPHL